MLQLSRLGCPMSLKTPNMGNPGSSCICLILERMTGRVLTHHPAQYRTYMPNYS